MIDRILTALSCGNGSCPCASSVRKGQGLVHCCSHADPTPSLNVSPGKSVEVVVTCHGGCDQATVLAALRERGLWPTNVSNPGPAPRMPTNVGELDRREVARFEYQNADGSPAFTIVKYFPKDFRALGPVPEAARVLYHLPEVLAAVAAKETIFVCEGEKDTDALRALGVVATCNPFGAGKFLERYAESLIGANVVVCQDRDDAGRAHAKDVAQKLSVAARSVKILEFPQKDAADWVQAGGSVIALAVLVDDLPEWTSGEKVIHTARDLAPEYRIVLEKRIAGDPEYVGWRTGFPSLDKEMRYRTGELWMVAAATSVGKSALMQSLQRRVAVPSVYFSLEMSRTQMLDRLIAAEAGVDSWQIARGALSTDERQRIYEALDRFEKSDMQMVDRATMTTATLESILRVARVRFGIRVVYLDYIGLLVEKDGESRYSQLTNISHALKRIASECAVCIVAGSQVNRKGDRKSGEPPFMEEMRDSGTIEEDAAVVLALGRAEGANEGKLAIRKNRNGIQGYSIPLAFDAMHAQFMEVGEARVSRSEPREAEAQEIPF